MVDFEKLLSEYDYVYPPEAVALEPASPRDSAKLLVFDPTTKQINFATYRDLPKYLPTRSCLVFNQTKVIPARIEVTKPSGGRARILFLRADIDNKTFFALSDRKLNIGESVKVDRLNLKILSVKAGEYKIVLPDGVDVKKLFQRYGQMPLPPYLKRTTLPEKIIRRKYQTVFAREAGSVAAPTASLHFTPRLLKALRKAGHEVVFITLHVNLGTFSPLRPEQVESGKLHEEYYEIDHSAVTAIRQAKKVGRPIIAVGTTVVRTLESAALKQKDFLEGEGTTRLFIRPGYKFKVVDGLITNFHVPKSSLMMLVAAFIGRETLLRLYKQAISFGCHIFSFGDGMLIQPSQKKLNLNKE